MINIICFSYDIKKVFFYKNIFGKIFEIGHKKNVHFYIFIINIKKKYEKCDFLIFITQQVRKTLKLL